MGKKRLQAYIDLGSSATKGLYWTGAEFQWLWMQPQFTTLSSASISRLRSEIEASSPEASAWAKVGEMQYAVGGLAQVHGGSSRLTFPKRDKAAYKLVAAIGVMAERLSLGSEFELDLGVVLPIDEYWTDRKVLKELTSWFKARKLIDRVTWSNVLVADFQYYLPSGMSQIDAIRYCDV